MLLKIDDHKTIEDLQDRFNECFPHLKLEFYSAPHKWNHPSERSLRLKPQSRIGDIRHNHNSGILEIKSWHKTGKVEQDLHDLFGLNAQIFRWYGDTWLQTSYSDDLTLHQQAVLAGNIIM
jgi:hypothetical protein